MISREALKILEWLNREGEDLGYPRELVNEGRVWMIGIRGRVSGRVVKELLYYCCVKGEGEDNFQRFVINETGRDILKNPEEGCKRVDKLLNR